MCARRVLTWSSRYLTLYVGARLCTPSTCEGVWTSSTLAVTGEELVEQLLKRRVLGHDVVFAQVVAAGGAGVHLRSERPLEASLRRDRRREGEEVSGGPRARAAAAGNRRSGRDAPCKRCACRLW